MNGVCVKWKGWLDIQRLEGLGCLEFNEEMAKVYIGMIDKILYSLSST